MEVELLVWVVTVAVLDVGGAELLDSVDEVKGTELDPGGLLGTPVSLELV